MKQILLLTDGCSNVGISPETAAAAIYQQGVVVNAIGLLDDGETGRHGMEEVKAIARFGGGLARFVHQADLAQTVQAITVQAMTQTIHRVVSDELRRIFRVDALESLPPKQRLSVYQMMERVEEEAVLRLVVLIDTSASMRNKFKAIQKALNELSVTLRSRQGNSQISVALFPGKGALLDVKAMWMEDGLITGRWLSLADLNGTTPTGPALMGALRLFDAKEEAPFSTLSNSNRHNPKQGWLSDHVV